MTRQRGTLVLRHNQWRLRLRRKDVSGATRFFWKTIGSKAEYPTRASARRAADRYVERINPREITPGAAMEWAQWVDVFLEQSLANRSTGTRSTQGSIINLHLRNAFSGPLHAIDREAVQNFVTRQRESGAKPATVAARFAVLRRMLRHADSLGLAVTPPTLAKIDLPKNEQVNHVVRRKAFTPAECERIFAAASDRDRMAYMLGRYLGLRASEVLGLEWTLIELTTGAVEIRQQALDGELRPLKTRGSKATLQAPPVLLEALRAYHRTSHPQDAFLFADSAGRPETAAALRERLHDTLRGLGLRKRGLHGFRHACALAMADAGVNPEAIRRAMRHSSLRVTAIYLSAAPEDIAAAIARGAGTAERGPNEARSATDSASNPASDASGFNQ